MTWHSLWLPSTFPNNGDRPPVWAAVLIGAAIGFLWGAIARVFMRLIAEDPEFSVEGTAGILLGLAFAGGFAGLAFAAQRRGWRRWRQVLLRALAFAVLLVIGGMGQVAALTLGVFLVPAPLLVLLGVTRVGWPRIVRAALLIATLGPLVIVSSEFISDSRLSGLRSAAIVPFLAWLVYGNALVLRLCLEPVARPKPAAGVSTFATPTSGAHRRRTVARAKGS
ncbi:MAG: hypothetical protein O6913_03240 [Chloroflexi bacterium]|nr:hypothetical protein [Chloroflexota bacterium]